MACACECVGQHHVVITGKFQQVYSQLMSGKSFRVEERLKMQSGKENSSSGCFNPVGHLQQSGCLGSYPP